MKPYFVNTGGSKYKTLNLSFSHKVWWWIPSLDKHHFFDLVDENHFIDSMLRDNAVLVVDHSIDPIKIEEFDLLYYAQFKTVFEEHNISTDRLIVLEPSPSAQFYMTVDSPNYVSVIDKFSLPKKFTHIMFNSLFLNYWRRWENDLPSFKRDPKKHFLTLARHDKFSRRFINYSLHKNNLYNKGYVSHVMINFDNDSTHNYQLEMLQTRSDFDTEQYLKFGFTKHILDTDTPAHHPKISDYTHLANKVCFELVHDSFITDCILPTEKVFKPLYSKIPFLYVGSPFTLKYLKSLGFGTFDSIFDESYDSELVFYDRVKIIIENMKKLCALSLNDCEEYLRSTQEVCEHNHKHFIQMDKGFNINKRINDALTSIFR